MLVLLVAEFKVANPIRIKQIAEARTKTDKLDALILARLLAANLILEVWVPPVHIRELCQLFSQRRRLVPMHTKVVNRMHSFFHRNHFGHPKGKCFQIRNISWKNKLLDMERFQLEMDLETKKYLKGQIEWLTKKLGTMSHQTPWESMAMNLMQPWLCAPPLGDPSALFYLFSKGDLCASSFLGSLYPLIPCRFPFAFVRLLTSHYICV
jgi:hypothetical protein